MNPLQMSDSAAFDTVYRLRDDPASLASMQAGSASDGKIGLRMTHGLIGSERWWNCMTDGALQVHVLQGEVSGFWPGQWGDGPAEFELRSIDGTASRWLCQIDPGQASEVFRLGRVGIVEYVEQELKTAFEGRTRTNVVIRIALDRRAPGPSEGRWFPAQATARGQSGFRATWPDRATKSMKKPAYFGEREVAQVASETLEDLRQEGLELPHLRSGIFNTDGQGQIHFSLVVELTAAVHGRTEAHNLWFELRLPHTSVKNMAARGTFQEIEQVLSGLSHVENARTLIFSILEDLDRQGR